MTGSGLRGTVATQDIAEGEAIVLLSHNLTIDIADYTYPGAVSAHCCSQSSLHPGGFAHAPCNHMAPCVVQASGFMQSLMDTFCCRTQDAADVYESMLCVQELAVALYRTLLLDPALNASFAPYWASLPLQVDFVWVHCACISAWGCSMPACMDLQHAWILQHACNSDSNSDSRLSYHMQGTLYSKEVWNTDPEHLALLQNDYMARLRHLPAAACMKSCRCTAERMKAAPRARMPQQQEC